MMLPGCELEITCLDSDTGQLPEIEVHDVRHGVIVENNDGPELTVMQGLNDMLSEYVDPNNPDSKLFQASITMTRALETTDPRWPVHYVAWELALLRSLGFAERFRRCHSDYRNGETIYISPRSGRVASRLEVGAYIDKMFPVPSLLMGAKSGSLIEVQQSLDVLTLLFEDFVSPELCVRAVPSVRDTIRDFVDQCRVIPPPEKVHKSAYVSEEDRRRRLLAMRPLMVSARSGGASSAAGTV